MANVTASSLSTVESNHCEAAFLTYARSLFDRFGMNAIARIFRNLSASVPPPTR